MRWSSLLFRPRIFWFWWFFTFICFWIYVELIWHDMFVQLVPLHQLWYTLLWYIYQGCSDHVLLVHCCDQLGFYVCWQLIFVWCNFLFLPMMYIIMLPKYDIVRYLICMENLSYALCYMIVVYYEAKLLLLLIMFVIMHLDFV
jgi:hypothetical protein